MGYKVFNKMFEEIWRRGMREGVVVMKCGTKERAAAIRMGLYNVKNRTEDPEVKDAGNNCVVEVWGGTEVRLVRSDKARLTEILVESLGEEGKEMLVMPESELQQSEKRFMKRMEDEAVVAMSPEVRAAANKFGAR